MYVDRKTNPQNDAWIEEHERYRQVSAHPLCIRLYLLLNKENDVFDLGWTILILKRNNPHPTRSLHHADVTFNHDKAPCFQSCWNTSTFEHVLGDLLQQKFVSSKKSLAICDLLKVHMYTFLENRFYADTMLLLGTATMPRALGMQAFNMH